MTGVMIWTLEEFLAKQQTILKMVYNYLSLYSKQKGLLVKVWLVMFLKKQGNEIYLGTSRPFCQNCQGRACPEIVVCTKHLAEQGPERRDLN